MKKLNAHYYFYIVLLLLAIGGFLALLLAPQDVGIGPDSMAFISAARSFLAGSGFSWITWDGEYELMVHFPPLYSFFLAVAGFGKLDPLQSAKWFNAFVLVANVFLVGVIVRRVAKHDWIALFGAAIFLTGNLSLETHFSAMTESLFILLMLAAIGLLGFYLKRQHRVWLVVTALLIGLAIITRYVGVTLIGATILTLLLYPYAKKKKRIYDAILFTAVSLTPIALWLIRNWLFATSTTNRTIIFHPLQISELSGAIHTFGLWVLPGIRTTLGSGAIFIFLMAFSYAIHRRFNRPESGILMWCGLFVLVYCGFLIFSITFIDAATPLNPRILFPVYAASLIWLLSGFSALLPRIKAIPFVRVLPLAVSLAYLGLSITSGVQYLNSFYLYGQGFTSQSWQDSELMNQALLLSENRPIYSNAPDAIYFVGDKVSRGIPVQVFATSRLKNEAYDLDFNAMITEMSVQNAKIVYFNRVSRWYLPTQEELVQVAPFSIIFENDEGAIYAYDP